MWIGARNRMDEQLRRTSGWRALAIAGRHSHLLCLLSLCLYRTCGFESRYVRVLSCRALSSIVSLWSVAVSLGHALGRAVSAGCACGRAVWLWEEGAGTWVLRRLALRDSLSRAVSAAIVPKCAIERRTQPPPTPNQSEETRTRAPGPAKEQGARTGATDVRRRVPAST